MPTNIKKSTVVDLKESFENQQDLKQMVSMLSTQREIGMDRLIVEEKVYARKQNTSHQRTSDQKNNDIPYYERLE